MDARRLWLSWLVLVTLAICGPAVIGGIAPAHADEVADWNAIAIDALVLGGQNPVVMTRGLAMAHLAVHDALNAIDRRYEPYLYDARAEPGAAPGAAVTAAMLTLRKADGATAQVAPPGHNRARGARIRIPSPRTRPFPTRGWLSGTCRPCSLSGDK
jgi:hypothetical protein